MVLLLARARALVQHLLARADEDRLVYRRRPTKLRVSVRPVGNVSYPL